MSPKRSSSRRSRRSRRAQTAGASARQAADRHRPVESRRGRRLLIAAAAFVALVLAVMVGLVGVRPWQRWAGGVGPAELSVLLVTLDTTRADHLGCYGNRKGLTPNIDSIAAAGTLFAQCSAAAPITLPSHATIMTGLYPYVHGARHNTGYQLAEGSDTLAEALAAAGYANAAFVAAMVLNRDTGMDQGFHTYDDVGTRHERPAGEVTNQAIAWLRAHAGRKFFLWVHYFDPHAPYAPPPTYRRRGVSPYEGEIAFVDAQAGRLFDALRRLELDRRTLVVLTADHGEGLGQHGEETHLHFVYDTTVSVPLVLHCPGRIPAGQVIQAQVRSADIAPTVLALLEMDPVTALPRAQGVDLTAWIHRSNRTPGLAAYGESLSGWIVFGTSPLRYLREDGWKYIHAPRPELYHVADDPGELRNLAEQQPDRMAAMRAKLRRIVHVMPGGTAAAESARPLDRAALDRLASLGYLGGRTDQTGGGTDQRELLKSAGPDPKDHLSDFAASSRAVHYLQGGEYARAEAVYRGLVDKFPDQAELAMQMARAMFLQGKLDEAVEVYRGLCRRHPVNADVHYGLGKLLARKGEIEQAIGQFALAAELRPALPSAHYDLGVLLMKRERVDEAVASFRHALRARPTYVDAMVNLGACLARQQKPLEAAAQYRAALVLVPRDATVHFNLGNALARAGDRLAAIEAYEEALRLDPTFSPARQALEHVRRGR